MCDLRACDTNVRVGGECGVKTCPTTCFNEGPSFSKLFSQIFFSACGVIDALRFLGTVTFWGQLTTIQVVITARSHHQSS
jgi:hypothetical protein